MHGNSNIKKRQCTYNVTLRRVRANIVAVEKQWVLHNLSVCFVCVYVAFGIQHAMRMRHSHLRPAPLYSIFPHYLTNGTIFENMFRNTKCVFLFSLQFLSESFLILRRNERDMIKMYIGLHVKYPLFLSDFNETWVFSADFLKSLKHQISWNPVSWKSNCSMRTDSRTDMTKLIVAFRKFANASKNRKYILNDILLLTLFFGFLFSTQFITTAIRKPSHSTATPCTSNLTQWFGDSVVNNQRFQARISHEHLKSRFLLQRKRCVAVTNIVSYVSGKSAICCDNHVKSTLHYVDKSFQCKSRRYVQLDTEVLSHLTF